MRPHSRLLPQVSQFEVDFVIPRVGTDLPLGIDPFLLYKSRDPVFSNLHARILSAFNNGVNAINQQREDYARYLFEFPEVSEIGLGYTKKGKRGSGVGTLLSSLIVETLVDTPLLRERGISHIEEMQLVSIGIGPDRISDITANLLKEYLIGYTQKQCILWNIPVVKNVPVAHIFDFDSQKWFDGYFDLPLSPHDDPPMLFVPRRIVRALPWINYRDYFRFEFSAYLRSKRIRARQKETRGTSTQRHSPRLPKPDVITVTRNEIERLDRFVAAKEATASAAQPSFGYLDEPSVCLEAESLKDKLAHIVSGTDDAVAYQMLALEILNFLFNPELINGELEVRTIEGTERRDIIFTNDSDKTFWTHLRNEHSAIFLMFETKNVEQLDNRDINQAATYLGDRLGRLGFIVTRNQAPAAQQKKLLSVYNDSTPRKIILVLSDQDLANMLDAQCEGKDPMGHIQRLYREFRTQAQ